MDDIDLLTVEQAAGKLQAKPETARDCLRAGKLRGVKFARGRWRIRPRDLAAFIESQLWPAPPRHGDAAREDRPSATPGA
jgi:excisionase family DNA binding protein